MGSTTRNPRGTEGGSEDIAAASPLGREDEPQEGDEGWGPPPIFKVMRQLYLSRRIHAASTHDPANQAANAEGSHEDQE